MRKEQLSNHHGTTGLHFVSIEVQGLQAGALFEGLGQVLSSIRFDVIAHQI